MIFFYIVFIFVISPLCLYLPDRIPTADSSENYSGQAGVLHFDNFYFPSENNTTVNINSMKSNVATFSSLFPRGERLKFLSDHEVRIRFQSTFPRGERQNSWHYLDCALEFQSTFPRGERQSDGSAYASLIEFQSTFPRGERRGLIT